MIIHDCLIFLQSVGLQHFVAGIGLKQVPRVLQA